MRSSLFLLCIVDICMREGRDGACVLSIDQRPLSKVLVHFYNERLFSKHICKVKLCIFVLPQRKSGYRLPPGKENTLKDRIQELVLREQPSKLFLVERDLHSFKFKKRSFPKFMAIARLFFPLWIQPVLGRLKTGQNHIQLQTQNIGRFSCFSIIYIRPTKTHMISFSFFHQNQTESKIRGNDSIL